MANYAYCHACHAVQAKENRSKNPLSYEQLRRKRAASHLYTYIARGKIEPKPCPISDGKPCSHSTRTYPLQRFPDRPLEVEWYCKRHLRMAKNQSDGDVWM